MKLYQVHVVLILFCKNCKFSGKVCCVYENTDVFIGDYFIRARNGPTVTVRYRILTCYSPGGTSYTIEPTRRRLSVLECVVLLYFYTQGGGA